MRGIHRFVKRLSFTALALGCAGCNPLLGLEDGILAEERCEPDKVVPCYTGPTATDGVGACRAGQKRCKATGDGYGACEGEVTPALEQCGNDRDDDCDGGVDEEADGCACTPGSIAVCAYSGPEKTERVGACRAGQRTCSIHGRWSPCLGEVLPRTEDCATPTDDDCDGSEGCGAATTGALAGGTSGQWARALAAAPAGGAVLGGEFEGALDLRALDPRTAPLSSSAGHDVFVAHLGGATSWVRPLVDRGQGSLSAVAVDANGKIAIVGELQWGEIRSAGIETTDNVGFLIKLDAGGAVEPNASGEPWATVFPGRPRGVAITPNGELVVASQLGSDVESDVEIAWYGPTGLLRSRVLGGAGQQTPTGIAVDTRGQVLVVGSFENALELGEGEPPVVAAGNRDIFLATLDGHGAVVDCRRFGDARDQRGGDVAAGPNGEIALSGAFEGTLDLVGQSVGQPSVFAAELGARGETLVHRVFPGETPPEVTLGADGSLLFAADVAGSVELGGLTIGAAQGGLDVLVARIGPQGDHLWSRRYGAGAGMTGGLRSTAGLAVAAGPEDILLSATVDGSIDFGRGAVRSTGPDVLLVHVAP